MTRRLHFEQLQRISGEPTGNRLGHSALKLYEDTLNRPLVWLTNRQVFVATENSDLRGVANMEIGPASRYAYLIGIAVAPAHRDRGVGRFMIEHLLQHAAEQDCTHLQVIPKMQVEEFYAHLGFARRSENSMYWVYPLQSGLRQRQ